PFTFLPIYASLEHVPRNLIEASHDLGASPAKTFLRVILPLSLPGVLAGAPFAFVLSLGEFLAPPPRRGLKRHHDIQHRRHSIRRRLRLAQRRRHIPVHTSNRRRHFVHHRARREEVLISMSRSSQRASAPFLKAYAFLVYAFLYLPIIVLVVYSFNGGVGGFPPHGWTLSWYRELGSDGPLWDSVLNSLIVAFAAVAISLSLGLPAALALDRSESPGKAPSRPIFLPPLILPGIITGLSLL